MTDKVLLKKSVGSTLAEFGFTRRSQTWYLHGSDNIVVLNMQKDDFSDLYYLNSGVWLRGLGADEYPKENYCHLRARLERLFPNFRELIFDACTINPNNSQLPEFVRFLRQEFVPFAQSCQTEDGLKDNIRSGRIPIHYVYHAAQIALGLVAPNGTK